jgi:hypothetical protein
MQYHHDLQDISKNDQGNTADQDNNSFVSKDDEEDDPSPAGLFRRWKDHMILRILFSGPAESALQFDKDAQDQFDWIQWRRYGAQPMTDVELSRVRHPGLYNVLIRDSSKWLYTVSSTTCCSMPKRPPSNSITYAILSMRITVINGLFISPPICAGFLKTLGYGSLPTEFLIAGSFRLVHE